MSVDLATGLATLGAGGLCLYIGATAMGVGNVEAKAGRGMVDLANRGANVAGSVVEGMAGLGIGLLGDIAQIAGAALILVGIAFLAIGSATVGAVLEIPPLFIAAGSVALFVVIAKLRGGL